MMSGEQNSKEVNFEEWCKRCKYQERSEKMIPCCFCLEVPFMNYTDKPVKWEEKE